MKKNVTKANEPHEIAHSLWEIFNICYESHVQSELDMEDLQITHKYIMRLVERNIISNESYLQICRNFRTLYLWQKPPKPRNSKINGENFRPYNHTERMAVIELQTRKFHVYNMIDCGCTTEQVRAWLNEREKMRPILNQEFILEYEFVKEWYL